MKKGSFWDFLYFVRVILFCVAIFLLQEYKVWVTAKLRPLTVAVTCIITALRHEQYRTSACCRCSEEAKISSIGNIHVLNLYNDCTLNCVRLCPSYCSNPEQCILGVALNRITVWRASEVQKELFKSVAIPHFKIHICVDKNLSITAFPSKDHFLHSLLQTKVTITAKP